MKITLNKIIAKRLKQGKRVFLPRIGVIEINNRQLRFNNTYEDEHNNSILEDIKKMFNINDDIAYKRYECWRHAITIKEDTCDIIRIEDVIWIAIDNKGDFYYIQSPKLEINKL